MSEMLLKLQVYIFFYFLFYKINTFKAQDVFNIFRELYITKSAKKLC